MFLFSKEVNRMEFNNENMSTSDMIRMVLTVEHQNTVSLAHLLNMTQQNVSQRLRKGNFRENELKKYADALDYEVIITFRKRG